MSADPSKQELELQEARVAAAARDGGRPWSEGWEPDARQVEDDQNYWLLTMVDLMTLLLTLFVLLAAYAYQHKAQNPIEPGSGAQTNQPANTDQPAASDATGDTDPPETVIGGDKPNPDARTASGDALIGERHERLFAEPGDAESHQQAPDRTAGSTMDAAGRDSGGQANETANDKAADQARALAGQFADMGDDVEVSTIADRVQLRVKDNILFPTAEAGLSQAGRELLTRLADRLDDSDYRITVEGHTDNRPIQTWRYPSNWELSAARAAAVVRELIDAGIRPRRLHAVGLADTQPIAGNGTAAGRAENRRVDLVLELPAAEENAR
ncbi:OmpA family protein [Guyparkeria halophila]|uniref:OmpA family protein n=1 Tax=Guyparkeria halophila TaxID=47960 RepID=A0ABZ0YVQ0_9GAMM|nr:OmpA family protein [Guyparkeria halophila]WQH15292.1 OmpA family protein [Guyparkeria halophila]